MLTKTKLKLDMVTQTLLDECRRLTIEEQQLKDPEAALTATKSHSKPQGHTNTVSVRGHLLVTICTSFTQNISETLNHPPSYSSPPELTQTESKTLLLIQVPWALPSPQLHSISFQTSVSTSLLFSLFIQTSKRLVSNPKYLRNWTPIILDHSWSSIPALPIIC